MKIYKIPLHALYPCHTRSSSNQIRTQSGKNLMGTKVCHCAISVALYNFATADVLGQDRCMKLSIIDCDQNNIFYKKKMVSPDIFSDRFLSSACSLVISITKINITLIYFNNLHIVSVNICRAQELQAAKTLGYVHTS